MRNKAVRYLFLFLFILALTLVIWLPISDLMYTEGNFDKRTLSNKTKYILQWTRQHTIPFVQMGKGQDVFVKNRCAYNNCYVTSNRIYFKSLTDFDAILYHGPELYREKFKMPVKRLPYQKYVYVSIESSHYYPICHDRYRYFFNWTWTYKLDSDVYYGYLVVRNKVGEVIGPKEEMHWIDVDEMKPIDEGLKARLSSKKLAAAWFVSNCKATSGRQDFAEHLQQHLAIFYNLTLDIYGGCGVKKCPASRMSECLRKIEEDYYFYLSFENSFSEDYVTEKLLNALQHNAVPIVFGEANYTRFMPEGIYLDARQLGVPALARRMSEIISNKEEYYKFFRWQNHYTYHNTDELPDTNYYCQFCAMLNSDASSEVTVYDDFAKWWNPEKMRENAC